MTEPVPRDVLRRVRKLARQAKEARQPARKADRSAAHRPKKARFTHKQGQFLAFLHLYRRLHRKGPAELDMIQFFRVTPPSVHGMVVKLEQLGLVTRETRVPCSVRVAISEGEIPALEEVEGPPW